MIPWWLYQKVSTKTLSRINFKGTKGIEAWVCYSTISLNLYESWAKLTHLHARLFLAPGTPLLRENSIRRSELESRPDVIPYTLKQLLLLALLSGLSGSRLRIRVPHLHRPTCHKHLLLLRKLLVIQLELYDDGFLGVVEAPTVCKHLQPVFSSLCAWDIYGWQLSDATIRCLSGRKDLSITHLHLKDLCSTWRHNNEKVEKDPLIIIEAKYMDYFALNYFIYQRPHAESGLSKSEVIPKYFEHPWEIKRNHDWSPSQKRDFVHESPIEYYLSRSIGPDTLVITGMTSTAVIMCDLIRKKALPSCRFTLLLSTKQSEKEYHCQGELYSYIDFMDRTYSSEIDLKILLDGERVRFAYG